ncbi:hypothetical protein Mal4_03910 [Maioricimonas rarisocia]|uniref:Methyltransferase FkbM domain-containing protein n=1 Tax=Maioricimonas rarisocia TaxID=2528026 RepID=A0A517Z0V1_9PLAN|nr:FkbM family methyltransferase [Maioricimonas rarisocia]QDU36108.1 hypothetical protein Mal4_03910 [Maioricimonas rarisocia]
MRLVGRIKSLLNDVARSRGYHIERIVDYGEHELDILRLAVESLRPEDPGFYFVQVGAHDGRTGDPLFRFVERYHWRGLLLEPQPDVFKALAENYSGETQLVLENAALAREDGTLPLYTVDGATYLASFDRGRLRDRVRDPARITEIPVDTVCFATLVERHAINRVDILQIDAEGFDFEIIRMALHSPLPKPRMIRYEHLHLSPADRGACADLLASHGYRMFRDGTDTMAYLQASQ